MKKHARIVVHKKDLRLRNNAGIDYPVCQAVKNSPMNMEYSRWRLENDMKNVTCKNCISAWKKLYPWAEN